MRILPVIRSLDFWFSLIFKISYWNPGRVCTLTVFVPWPCLCPGLVCALTVSVPWPCLYPDRVCALAVSVSWPCLYPDRVCTLAVSVSWPCLYPGRVCTLAVSVPWPCLYPLHLKLCAVVESRLTISSNFSYDSIRGAERGGSITANAWEGAFLSKLFRPCSIRKFTAIQVSYCLE
jgi:hypothetical protein